MYKIDLCLNNPKLFSNLRFLFHFITPEVVRRLCLCVNAAVYEPILHPRHQGSMNIEHRKNDDGKQRDWRKSCPLVTLSTRSPTRISLWLDSDLGPDILLPYVGKCGWNYFHKHNEIRLRPERCFFIWFKATYLYSITRFLHPIHRLLFKEEHNLGTICSGREEGPTDLGQTKRNVLSHTPSADEVP